MCAHSSTLKLVVVTSLYWNDNTISTDNCTNIDFILDK